MKDTFSEKWLAEYNAIIKENDNLYRDLAKNFKLPECAFWILYTLRIYGGPITQSEICDCLYQPKQTVNSALKNLEAEGYIQLKQADDHRRKQISLTYKGAELAGITADKVIAAELSSAAALTQREREILIKLFRKYTDALSLQINHLKK